jgi:tetratricopeptide (TPR) repeat protein
MGLIPEVRSRALGERLLRRNVGLRPTVTAAPPPGAPARPIDSMVRHRGPYAYLFATQNACIASAAVLQAAAKVKEMKSEGNKLFAQREYAKAMQQYEDAMKMLPDGASERADFLCNKGACLYSQQKCAQAHTHTSHACTGTPSLSC